MLRSAAAALLLALAALTAQAHFVFVVPDAKDPAKALVVFSDDLDPDENVGVEKLATLKLTCRDASGKDVAVEHKAGKHELTAALPGSGPRVVLGTLNYGVIGPDGRTTARLVYDHRVMDGGTIARALGRLDEVLNGEMMDELTEIGRAGAVRSDSRREPGAV